MPPSASLPFLVSRTVTLLIPTLLLSVTLPAMLTTLCVPTKLAMRSTFKLLNVWFAGLKE